MKNIYCFVGKSGSGKDTVVNNLCKNYGYKRVVSWTTRERRKGDMADSASHIFGTVDDYNKAKDGGNIVAETYFDGNYYWVTRSQIDEADLYIVDLAGLRQLRKDYTDKPVIGVWVGANADVRKGRMLKRGDSEDKVDARIENDEEEFEGFENEKYKIAISNNYNGSIRDLVRAVHKEIQVIEKKPDKKPKLIENKG